MFFFKFLFCFLNCPFFLQDQHFLLILVLLFHAVGFPQIADTYSLPLHILRTVVASKCFFYDRVCWFPQKASPLKRFFVNRTPQQGSLGGRQVGDPSPNAKMKRTLLSQWRTSWVPSWEECLSFSFLCAWILELSWDPLGYFTPRLSSHLRNPPLTHTHTHTHTGYFTFLWFWGVFWYKLSQYFI